MARNIDTIAQKLGGIRGRSGPGGGRPGRPTGPSWVCVPKVPMSAITMAKLAELAAQAGTAVGGRISPMQLAAQILEEAVAHLPAQR